MDLDENNSDDTSDDDYVPGKDSDEEVVSEVSDVESDASGDGEENPGQCRKRKLSKTKTVGPSSKLFKRKGGIKLEDGESERNEAHVGSDAETNEIAVVGEESAAEREEKERERANSLWKDFMKDSDLKPKQTKSVLKSPELTDTPTKTNELVVTKEFNFAGEVVRVTAVDSDSKKSNKVGSASDRIEVENEHNNPSPLSNSTVKKPGGLNSVLNKISGLKKMSTLEKSRLDWNIFKEDEGISDDLKSFNRGKNGYLENQAFLQRADERQFAIEKDFRVSRSKR